MVIGSTNESLDDLTIVTYNLLAREVCTKMLTEKTTFIDLKSGGLYLAYIANQDGIKYIKKVIAD